MKQLALILILALLIFTCGCQPASLSSGPSTEPSKTEPSVDVPATEPSQTELSRGNTNANSVYTVLDENGRLYGEPEVGQPAISIIRSTEESPDWLVELLETTVENYSENYFEDHSVVVICCVTGSTVARYRVADVSEADDGGYLFNLEYCMPEMGNEMMWKCSVVVAVNQAIPEDAVIQVEITSVFMSNEEFEAYFGEISNGGC